jgi:hypothetical protein
MFGPGTGRAAGNLTRPRLRRQFRPRLRQQSRPRLRRRFRPRLRRQFRPQSRPAPGGDPGAASGPTAARLRSDCSSDGGRSRGSTQSGPTRAPTPTPVLTILCPLTISGVAACRDRDDCTLRWTVSAPATGQAEYGTTTALECSHARPSFQYRP